MSPLTADQCDKVENYAFIWRIRGKDWLSRWKSHPDGLAGKWEGDAEARLEELNTLRETVMEPLARLSSG